MTNPNPGILDAVPVAVIELDLDRNVRYWNPAAERIFGWTAAEVLGRPNPIVPDHEWDEHLARTDSVLAGGSIDAVRRRTTKDGGSVDVRIHCTSLPAEGGLVVVAEDVTARLRAEAELARVQAIYRQVVENVADVVTVIDRDGRIVFSSNATHEPGERPWFAERLHPDDRKRALELVAAAFGGAEPKAVRVRAQAGDGTWRILEGLVVPLAESDDAVLAITRDVTEHERLQTELAQAQRLEAVGRLSSGVAHDFNNLLTAISGYSELARARLGGSDPGTTSALEQISAATSRAAQLTKQLLAFSRRQILRPTAVDLDAVVCDLEPLLDHVSGERVTLRVDLGGVGCAWADAGQLEQVILNLVINGRDAMPGGGTLTVSTAEVDVAGHAVAASGRYVVVSVADTGVGMDDETRSRIFEPFFSTKGVDKGTGLGLASVYGIVSQSGGFVDVESAPGAGSTFRVHLPRSTETAAAPPSPRRPPAEGGTESIVVVEDTDVVRGLVERMLGALGYDVRTFRDGPEAIASLAGDELPDLVLTDVVMPQMTGHELAAELRRRDPELRVLFMSGNSGPDADDGLLPKPFTQAQLARAVRAALMAA